MTDPTRPARLRLRSPYVVALLMMGAAAAVLWNSQPAGKDADLYFSVLRGAKDGSMTAEEQLQRADKMVALRPDAVAYREMRSDLLMHFGRMQEAKADLDHAIAVQDRPWLRFRRGTLLCTLQQYEPALADLDLAVAQQPENMQFYIPRMLSHFALGRLDQAEADAQRLMQDPRWSTSAFAIGAIELARNRPMDALPWLERSIGAGTSYREAYLLRAEAYDRVGNSALARADREAARRLSGGPRPGLCFEVLDPMLEASAAKLEALPSQAAPATPADSPAAATAAAVPTPAAPDPPRMLRVESSSAGRAVVDLDGEGVDPEDRALDTLNLVDEAGVRRVIRHGAVRPSCTKLCGEEDEPVCHPIADYLLTGESARAHALARPDDDGPIAAVPVGMHALASEAEKAAHLAAVFANGFGPLEPGGYAAGWEKQGGGWVLKQDSDGKRSAVGPTLERCSVSVSGDLTEFECGGARWLFAGNRYVGFLEDASHGPMVRFAFEAEGTVFFAVVQTANSSDFTGLLYRTPSGWVLRSTAPRYPSIC